MPGPDDLSDEPAAPAKPIHIPTAGDLARKITTDLIRRGLLRDSAYTAASRAIEDHLSGIGRL